MFQYPLLKLNIIKSLHALKLQVCDSFETVASNLGVNEALCDRSRGEHLKVEKYGEIDHPH